MPVDRFVPLRMGVDDADEILTLLGAAYVTEVRAHGDLTRPR